jgi:hypothetical protein
VVPVAWLQVEVEVSRFAHSTHGKCTGRSWFNAAPGQVNLAGSTIYFTNGAS